MYTDPSPERLVTWRVCVRMHTDTSPDRASSYLGSQHDLCCGILSNGYEFPFHKMKRVLNTDVGSVPQPWGYANCR